MSPRQRKMVLGGVLPILSVVIAGGAVTLASLASFGVWSGTREVLEDPEPEAIAALLQRAGITPETLAAVGASDEAVTQLVTLAVNHLDAEAFSAITQADEAVKAAKESESSLARRVRGGHGSGDDVNALRAAEQSLVSAKGDRADLLDAFGLASRAGLSQGQTATIARIRANSGWDVPTQYRVVARTEPEWVALRDALANVRVSDRLGEESDAECEALIRQCNADPAVAAAKSRLDTRLGQVSTAFYQALGLQG